MLVSNVNAENLFTSLLYLPSNSNCDKKHFLYILERILGSTCFNNLEEKS